MKDWEKAVMKGKQYAETADLSVSVQDHASPLNRFCNYPDYNHGGAYATCGFACRFAERLQAEIKRLKTAALA